MTHIIVPQTRSLNIRQEGDRVVVIEEGRLVLDMPYQGARALARALLAQAARAEEQAKAEAIIADQAILTRLGVPFGLTNTPALLKAAANEAAWNSKLRRYIPPGRAGGIASQAVVGTPTVIQYPPNGGKRE